MVTDSTSRISMILMDDWTPRSGELLEFIPTGQCNQAAHLAPPVSVPPSFVQQFHIANKIDAERAGAAPASSLGGCFTVDAPLDRVAMQRAIGAFVLRHETLRCWFSASAANGTFALTRHMVPPGVIGFTTTSVGVFDSGQDIRDVLAERFYTGTSPLRWPSFVYGAIDHGDNGFTVYFSTDHSHTDGYSILLGISELRSLYETFSTHRGPDALPPVGSHLELCRAEQATIERLDLGSPEIGDLLAVLLESGGRFQHVPVDFGLDPGETAPGVDATVAILDGIEADAFAAVAKANGASFSAGLFAALALTDLEVAGRTRYLSFNTVSTRVDPGYSSAQGWFINYLPIFFTMDESDRFTSLAPRAMTALDRVKPLTTVPILGLVDAASKVADVPVPTFTTPPMVAYLDFRRFDTGALPNVHTIRSLTANDRLGEYAQIWFCRESNRTVITVKYPGTPTANESVDAYLNHFRRIVQRVAHTGDYRVTTLAKASG